MEMENVLQSISYWIDKVPEELMKLDEEECCIKPSLTKWSKKEILGHLCDSAIVNIERFIKIQYEAEPYKITGYNQDKWVELQNYQVVPVKDILERWICLNKQVIRIIEAIDDEKLHINCDIGNSELKPLSWLINDYLEHMEHHITNQLLPIKS
ncbi:DinB family protein [Virgibacillus salexigens]|nr:DinB family protein [Virgibacillus kapii]GGJ49173.1 hypothetical protein GCM10007111_09120 [Virgibacillus kapii]